MSKSKTIEKVPLMRVGTWQASTGETSITRAHLDDIVAAYESGDLDNAVIKIGHTDPRFENPDWDGEPAYGQVSNLTVTDDKGGTLVGDYINVPLELAEKLDSAYPYRSVEINWDVEMLDDAGKVTATYPAVLTGLALLGASAPAVSGLGTVHSGFRARKTGAKQTSFTASVFSFDGGHTSASLRRALQDGLEAQAHAAGGDRWSRWVIDFDDSHIWYEDGSLKFQQTYAVAETGAISLAGDVLQVVEKQVFEPAPPVAVNGMTDTASIPHAVSASAESAGVNTPERAVKATTEGETAAMAALNDAQLTKLRTILGLSDTAPEDEVLAALETEKSTPEAEQAPAAAEAAPAEPEAKPEATAEAVEPEAAEAPAAVEAPTETVKLSAASFAQLQSANKTMAAQLKALTDKDNAARRDGLIKTAMTSGRLHPSEAPKWREALDKSEEVTASLLSERQPVFPVSEFGHDVAPAAFDAGAVVTQAQIDAENNLFRIGGNK